MTQAEAGALTAKLFAAYPFHRDNDQLTAAVYVEQLEKLPDGQIALQAVNDLIAVKRYLPVVAEVLEAYSQVVEARRARVRALEEPPPTPEQMAENARQARALLERLTERSKVMQPDDPAELARKRAAAERLGGAA